MASTAGTQSSDHPPGRERTSSPAGELACSISWFRKYSWRDWSAAAARRRRTAWVSVGTSLICTLGIHPPSRHRCPQKSDSRVTRPDLVHQLPIDESGVQSEGSLAQGTPARPPALTPTRYVTSTSTSMNSGAWSEGFWPLRALRSMSPYRARSASTFVINTRSIRIPLCLWKFPAR